MLKRARRGGVCELTGDLGVAIFVHCPQCHEQLAAVAESCPHCRAALPLGVMQALSSASGVPASQPLFTGAERMPTHVTQVGPRTYVAHHSAWRPWLAAGLSVISGLGQFYNGQVVKGLVLSCGAVAIAAAIGLLQSSLAMIIAPLWWGFGVIDAYRVALRG